MNEKNTIALGAFMHHLEHVQRRSAQTVRTYRYTLHYWLKWLGNTSLSEVRPEMVEKWAGRKRRGGKIPSAHTMRREVVIVRTFHQWAAERGFEASTVISAHAPTVKGRTPKPISEELWHSVWTSDLDESDRLFLGLGYFCGLRRIEMVTLRPEEVDLQSGTMRFYRKGGSPEPVSYRAMVGWLEGLPAHEGGEEWLDLFEATVRRRQELGANLVWWDAIGAPSADSERMARRLRKALTATGHPSDAFTLHQLRHSAATNLMRAGCPPELIRDQLSHSSWNVTSMYARTSGLMEQALEKKRNGGSSVAYG